LSFTDQVYAQNEPFPGETENAFLWRIGSEKDTRDITWSQIADIMNRHYRDDETEYRSESAYRKRYTQAREMYDSVIQPEVEETLEEEHGDAYMEKLREEKEKAFEEKVRMQDARRAYNKAMRANARFDENLAMLEDEIKKISKKQFPAPPPAKPVHDADNDLFCCVADLHYGIEYEGHGGNYSPETAEWRLMKYAEKIITIGQRHNSENAYVTMLGDMISGAIHQSILVENREDLIAQIMNVSLLMVQFIGSLAGHFKNVYVNAVGGNHSRIAPKDISYKNEKLDNLIIWYLKPALSHFKNVHVCEIKDNIDSTVASFKIRSNDYVSVHGDLDNMRGGGAQKLALWLGFIPYAIACGHNHTTMYNEPGDIAVIASGSLCGSGDAYTTEKRLRGSAKQTVCVCGYGGIEAIYPVRLS
jgi:hypothetical protein